MMNENKQGLYEVGYGKPPKSTQFQKGKSGNPGGLPKGTAKISVALLKLLALSPADFVAYEAQTIGEEIARAIIQTAIESKSSDAIRATVIITDRTEGTPDRMKYPQEDTTITIVYDNDWRNEKSEDGAGVIWQDEQSCDLPRDADAA
jgi:hypothetical protein